MSTDSPESKPRFEQLNERFDAVREEIRNLPSDFPAAAKHRIRAIMPRQKMKQVSRESTLNTFEEKLNEVEGIIAGDIQVESEPTNPPPVPVTAETSAPRKNWLQWVILTLVAMLFLMVCSIGSFVAYTTYRENDVDVYGIMGLDENGNIRADDEDEESDEVADAE